MNLAAWFSAAKRPLLPVTAGGERSTLRPDVDAAVILSRVLGLSLPGERALELPVRVSHCSRRPPLWPAPAGAVPE
jgi:hypothetical protein